MQCPPLLHCGNVFQAPPSAPPAAQFSRLSRNDLWVGLTEVVHSVAGDGLARREILSSDHCVERCRRAQVQHCAQQALRFRPVEGGFATSASVCWALPSPPSASDTSDALLHLTLALATAALGVTGSSSLRSAVPKVVMLSAHKFVT